MFVYILKEVGSAHAPKQLQYFGMNETWDETARDKPASGYFEAMKLRYTDRLQIHLWLLI